VPKTKWDGFRLQRLKLSVDIVFLANAAVTVANDALISILSEIKGKKLWFDDLSFAMVRIPNDIEGYHSMKS
jgi:hypothetical protein